MTTDAYAWFIVKSAGEYYPESGFKCSNNGVFDPHEFTSAVRQKPRECWKLGDKRTSTTSAKVQETCRTSSAWLSERVEAEGSDVYDICDRLVERFEPYIDEIRELRHSVPLIPVHAPIIYVYNDDEAPVTVTLDINGCYTYLDPEFNREDGWTITASPDGTLTDADGNSYEYRFWDADLLMDYELGYGYCVPGDETEAFLYDAISRLGLSDHEAEAFVAYWLPRMEGNEYNVINFQTTTYENAVHLNVSPSPDVVVRVNMLWYASDEYVEVDEQSIDDMNPTVDDRYGLTVVEWGGEMIEGN